MLRRVSVTFGLRYEVAMSIARLCRPIFEAEYAVRTLSPRNVTPDPVRMIDPYPALTICGIACLQVSTGPRRFAAREAAQPKTATRSKQRFIWEHAWAFFNIGGQRLLRFIAGKVDHLQRHGKVEDRPGLPQPMVHHIFRVQTHNTHQMTAATR